MNNDIKRLLEQLVRYQWTHDPTQLLLDIRKRYPIIMTREDLQTKSQKPGLFKVESSGSTGEPVTVQKGYRDLIWYHATMIREVEWLGWDPRLDIAVIKPLSETRESDGWGVSTSIWPVQGKKYTHGYTRVSEIQKWLEEKNPHYIHAPPGIINQLDLTCLSNFIDWKGTGELGGTQYSSEECGTIALLCPDNPKVWHVMENNIIEVTKKGEAVITCTTNPHIKRYLHGDHIELGECWCGRTLQTITRIYGRSRGMWKTRDGDTFWPMIGSREYYRMFGIKQYKAVQTRYTELELQIVRDPKLSPEEESKLIDHIQSYISKSTTDPVTVTLKYSRFDEMDYRKHEEFSSLM